MHTRRRLAAALVLGLSLLARPLVATTVDAPPLDSLIGQADYVVRAVVQTATPEWREHEGRRFIRTTVQLKVLEVIKGAPPSPLVLDLIGGKIGEDELLVEGMPRLQVGDEQVLFVRDREKKIMPIVALMHGVYPVVRDTTTGQAYPLRSNGTPLYSANDVSLPMGEVSAVRRLNPSARPLTLGDFTNQLRQRASVSRPTAREK